MKTAFFICAWFTCATLFAANPSFQSFNTDQFVATASVNTIRANTNPVNPNSLVSQTQMVLQVGRQLIQSNYISGNVRQELTNAFTWFVATTGNDSNPGTNVAAPLLTIQVGVDKALATDFGTNTATVQIADGRYEGTVVIKSTASTAAWQNKGGFLVLHGNDASPTSVILTNSATNHLVVAAYGAKTILASMYLTSTNRNNECLIDSQMFSYVGFSNLVLGACGANEAQLVAEANGVLEALGPYRVSAGGNAHALALGHGTIYIEQAVTFTNTPAYSNSFVRAYNGGALFLRGPFTGAISAPRYNIATGGAISTYNTSIVDALPGSSTGVQNLTPGEGAATIASLTSMLAITNTLTTNSEFDVLQGWHYGADAQAASMSFFKSRGNSVPLLSTMTPDDRILFFGAGGTDGTGWHTNKAVMTFNADGIWTSSSTPTYALWQTTSSNTTARSNSLRLNSDHTIATFGFNTLVLGTITVGASPFTYTTTGNHSEFVFIRGGTLSGVTVNGTIISQSGQGVIVVPMQPGESVVVAYTVVPAMFRKPY